MPRTTTLFVGLVLFIAGALKGLGLADWSPRVDEGILSSRWITIVESTTELALGLWLIAGSKPKASRLVALCTFLIFLIVAGSKGIHGESSCSCLGKFIEINPWYAFAFDLGALAALWRWPPGLPEAERSAAFAFFALSALALMVSVFSAMELVSYFRPNGIVVKGPSRVAVQHTDRKQPLEVVFRLYNPTSRAISIGSINTGCARVTAKIVDTIISPGQETNLLVQIHSFEDFNLLFSYRIQMETDSGKAVLWVMGTLPVSQTAFYRPQALFLEKDDKGNWLERTVKIRLPMKYAAPLNGKSIELSNCLDSKVWVIDDHPAGDHLEYTIHFAVSSKIASGWRGGSIDVRTSCGDLTIPVSILKTP